MALGIDDALFWRSTPAEIADVMERKAKREAAAERRAALRAGLIAAMIANVHRKKGTRPFRPTDFVRSPVRQATPEEFAKMMHEWATSHNAARGNGS